MIRLSGLAAGALIQRCDRRGAALFFGPVDAIANFHDALLIYLEGLIRARGTPELLERYRTSRSKQAARRRSCRVFPMVEISNFRPLR